jgi:hypothetical protein
VTLEDDEYELEFNNGFAILLENINILGMLFTTTKTYDAVGFFDSRRIKRDLEIIRSNIFMLSKDFFSNVVELTGEIERQKKFPTLFGGTFS